MSWNELEDLVVRDGVRPGTFCAVGVLLNSVTAEEAKAIQRVLDNPRYATSSIHRSMKSRQPDLKIAEGTIGRHRRGGCRCGQERP